MIKIEKISLWIFFLSFISSLIVSYTDNKLLGIILLKISSKNLNSYLIAFIFLALIFGAYHLFLLFNKHPRISENHVKPSKNRLFRSAKSIFGYFAFVLGFYVAIAFIYIFHGVVILKLSVALEALCNLVITVLPVWIILIFAEYSLTKPTRQEKQNH